MASAPAAGAGGNAGCLAEPLLAAANGGGVGAKDKYWVPADEKEEMLGASQEDGRPPQQPLLYRTFRVKGALINLYRLLTLVRVIVVILFFTWRMKHRDSDAMWLWWISVVGDLWFGVSWLLNQLTKLKPRKCIPNLSLLREQFEQQPVDGSSSGLPVLDVFINTVDPVDEPMLYTMNSVLSILATDYPAEKHATYFSDDGGSLVHYEGLLETAKFAALWVPFCRKHCVEPRAPESYFWTKTRLYAGNAPEEFVDDHRCMRVEYEEFKARLDALSTVIAQRSEACNHANTKVRCENATWMLDGTQWQGTWVQPAKGHRKGHHPAILQVMLNQPSNEPQLGMPASSDNPLDFSTVDVRLPMLVYISREKRPGYDHQKKAGAMNVQLRVSALLSNAPFIINFDGDHYINNSQAFRAAMCFMLDRRDGDDTAFVQFPQRFDDVDPTDRYCNHNRMFFDATLLGLNGIQGPSFVGTGCMFRRVALYGADPPRWQPDDDSKALQQHSPNIFGTSAAFVNSLPMAADQERSVATPVTLDEAELSDVMTCAYEDSTEWGNGVGWVYNIATEDVVTGFRLHRAGWRSMYCAMEPDAFRGTAPINLTERLYQILRWSGGSLEMFFSRFCPLLAGRRLHPMQRIAYVNMTTYPVSTFFIVMYDLYPVMWLFHGHFYIQKPFQTFALFVAVIIATVEVIGMVEVKWAGLTLLDWFRNEQFYIIGTTGVYPTAMLHILLRSLGLKGVSFKLTAKKLMTAGSARERLAELYDVQWAPLLAPTVVVLAVNVAAIGAAVGKAVAWRWSTVQVAEAATGLTFNVWMLLLLYPFALGIMGLWSKRPYVLFALLLAAVAATASVYVVLVGSVPDFLSSRDLGSIPSSKLV